MTAADIRPLHGIRIVDMTTNIAGPLAARMMAEMGADVIHIEPPWGDDGRNSTTAFLGREGTLYSSCNRSKRGIVVDVKQPAGQEIVRRLIKTADVFLEATVPGSLERIGLEYEALRELHPRLVQVSITGWGSKGPLAREQGYAVLAGAYSGSVRPPQRDGEAPELRGGSADPTAALLATIGTLGALAKRNVTGEGSLVTTSVFQAAMHLAAAFMIVAEQDMSPSKRDTGMIGALGGMAPFLTFDNKWIYISAWNDRQFRQLCELAELPHIAADPAFASRLQRTQYGVELNELIGAWVATQIQDKLVDLLRSERIPAAPMRMATAELFDDAQVKANEMFVPVDHPEKGRLWQLRNMLEFDGDFGSPFPAPVFGQHTYEILDELGFSEEEAQVMKDAGVVV